MIAGHCERRVIRQTDEFMEDRKDAEVSCLVVYRPDDAGEGTVGFGRHHCDQFLSRGMKVRTRLGIFRRLWSRR